MTLTKESAAEFELAVDRQYWYELVLDDLPMWGMVGEVLRDDAHGRMEKVRNETRLFWTCFPRHISVTHDCSLPVSWLFPFAAYFHAPKPEHIVQRQPDHRGEPDLREPRAH